MRGGDVPMIDEAMRFLKVAARSMPHDEEVLGILVDFAGEYTSPQLALAHILEKQENPALASAATLAPEPTEPRGGFLAREPVPEPGRPAHPAFLGGDIPVIRTCRWTRSRPAATGEPAPPPPPAQPGVGAPAAAGFPGGYFGRPRTRYEPRSADLPANPEYGTGNRFMDAPPLEPSEPQQEQATTLSGAPYPDRSAEEPGMPPAPPGPGARRADPDTPDLWPTRGHQRETAEPGRPPHPAGPETLPGEPGVPEGWQQSPQEWMSYAVMAEDVRARMEAIKGATRGMTEDPMPADVMMVANAVADRRPWREPPAEIADMAERALEGEELEEQEIVAMSAWHLNTAYPGLKWWEPMQWQGAQEGPYSRIRRPLPTGRDFIRGNAQVVDLIKSQEGFSAKPYPDPGGDPWTIGYGQTRIYRRNARGRVIEVGPVTQKTKAMTEEKAAEQLDLAIEFHYDALLREMPREAIDWLSDAQLAALTAMTYNRGPGAMGSEETEYKIKAGDSLSKIVAQKGVSYQRLLQANHIEDPDLIRVGDTLTIPGSPGTDELRRGLIDQDLNAVASAWFDTFNVERALSPPDGEPYAQGILNRRAASALFMFEGYPTEAEVMDAGGWTRSGGTLPSGTPGSRRCAGGRRGAGC